MATVADGFVGRDETLGLLVEELASARLAPRIVWVEGEAGIGKTTLVRRFLADAEPGCTVWASAAEEETSLTFGVIAALRRALRSGEREPFPLVARLDQSTDPFAAGADLLGDLGEVDGALVLVVDDLHWADAQSARGLLFALRRLEGEALLVVLTTRPDPASRLGEGWGRLLSDPGRVRRVPLGGLGARDLCELAEVTGSGRLELAAAERLRTHTHGHPLHARTLLEELGAEVLNMARGVLPAPRSLAAAILTKVGALDREAQGFLAAAAVLGSSYPLPVVANVAGVSDALSALETSVGAGLLECLPGGAARFVHPLVRAAVYNDLSATRRARLHLAAAAASEGVVAVGHRVAAAAAPDPDLAVELEGLASVALAAAQPGVAADHFEAAAHLWSDPADRDRCVLLAAEARFSGGDRASARSSRAAVEACGDTPLRAYVLGSVEYCSGRLAEAETLMARAVAGLGTVPGGVGARAAGWLGFLRLMLGRWEDALGPARIAAGTAGSYRAMGRFTLSVCFNRLGRIDQLHQLLAELEAEMAGPGRPELDTLIASGTVKSWTDDLAGAAADLSAVAERARAGEPCHMPVHGLSFLADAYYGLGEWDQAVVYSELAVSLATGTDQVLNLLHAHAVACYVHAGRGRFDIAEDHLHEVVGLAGLVPWWGTAVGLGMARATLATARGDSHGVLAAVSELIEGPMGHDLEADARMGSFRVMAADAFFDTGNLLAARQMLAGAEKFITDRGVDSLRTDTARLSGRLAEAGGDVEQAEAAYQAGLSHPDGLPLSTGRLELALGSLLRRTGQRRQAVDWFRRARQHLNALGAHPFLAHCDQELTACGLRSPAKDRGRLLDLTAAEITVAHLVVQGLSNREVAARLYVSVKAVEYHLSHIYAKLGIASRRQLADHIRRPATRTSETPAPGDPRGTTRDFP